MSGAQLFDLSGKVAIVTGGNGGLGLAMAMGLAQAGADIMLAARDTDKLSQAASRIAAVGGTAQTVKVDLTQEADVDRMVAETVRVLGRVDILVNNAGTTVRKEPQELSIDSGLI